MGVLGAEEIKRRLEEEEIFQQGTYHENCIDIASYNLRLDDEELIIDGNKYHKDNKYPYDRMGGAIILPARKISVISTIETLKLSNDLCGKCGITFSLSRKGLVSLFGPQIDPGYNDKFYAVIYNASPHSIKLTKGDKILKMEIHSVDGGIVGKPLSYGKLPPDIEIDITKEDFLVDLFNEVKNVNEKCDNIDKRLKDESAKIAEVTSGYRTVTYFGIFLVAASIFGVILAILFSAAGSANLASLLGKQFPLMILSIITTVFLIILTVAIVVKSVAKGGR